MIPYRQRYRKDLSDLKRLTKDLADRVGEAIERSVLALTDSNVELAREIIKNDQDVDDLSIRIENLCMELLVLQQPMARDLRRIIGILKIGIDLERIGDLAVDIARVTAQSHNKIEITKLEFIPRMAEISGRMLRQSMEALEKDDADMARQITKWDYEIDGLYVKARDKLLNIIIERPEVIKEGTLLLMVNRHLERTGDHICNVCETIVYMVEAKREHLN
ncbi:MAG TPA: phosphate signaling complex protein PhoU [Methanothrix sp.]|jgi:phosphate transport system protein|uniref:phosphate signaling complex protein PhoU n=1 Tax=Methanothrix sp. TaxID=90426 RepID=UPI002B52B5E5|nr:phosphate signaling complex protein PhoU [Methanothrix sp.]MDI9416529.1 phosphate signaling complex protein PhoU [Euryarchaeota archaeon]HON35823.1 phosphate signaling complex protein PhoU [Methanothrix sp.]HRU75091.1 phosphate signaling complex protein PhoU [Methanothrix sp.]